MPLSALKTAGGPPDLSEYVFETLRQAIVTGVLAPGERLLETEVARQLQVSRTPVREALLRLRALNLVSETPSGGMQVVSHPKERIAHMFAAREALEGMAARLAAERIDDAQLAALAEAVAEMAPTGPDDDRTPAWGDANTRLHAIVHGACGNPVIVEMLNNLYDAIRVYNHERMPQMVDRHALTDEHRAILEALRARDPDRAEQAMRRHIRSALKVWL